MWLYECVFWSSVQFIMVYNASNMNQNNQVMDREILAVNDYCIQSLLQAVQGRNMNNLWHFKRATKLKTVWFVNPATHIQEYNSKRKKLDLCSKTFQHVNVNVC